MVSRDSKPTPITDIGPVGSEFQQRYVRPRDVMRITGASKSLVMAGIYRGNLKAFQRGRAWFIPITAVTRWIEGDAESA